MSRFTLVLLLTITVAAVVLASSSPAFAQKTQNVVVTNTSANPVPVTGNVNAAVSGTVNVGNTPSVTVSGTPSVSISGTPAVTLASGATVGIDPSATVNTVDVSTRNIVFLQAEVVLDPNTALGSAVARKVSGGDYIVPSGKLLVINHISLRMVVPTGQTGYTLIGNGLGTFWLYPELHKYFATPGADFYAANVTGPVYVSEGLTPVVSFERSSLDGGAYVQARFQGYLVDCGSGCSTTY